MDRVRLIEQQHGVNYEALGKIRNELIELTRDKELFPRSSFPINDEVDRRSIEFLKIQITVMHSMHLLVPRKISAAPQPHYLGSYRGCYGDELNRFYERTDDASKEGYAELKETGSFVVQHGNGVVFLPDDIHAISTVIQNPQCICICMGSPWITCRKLVFDKEEKQ
ncbi:MAG: hypothetical protein CM1200mP18_21290 [Gammaproteobacteria bacterium]|nr:MAG: hypothetical protein CM1200mP18_21290 [Gammaproteobacteria bacterium]